MSVGTKSADRQMSGLAGEFFVAAELLKRGLQTSITFGNAKQIDLFAHCPDTNRTFTVQVKSLRFKNFFPISSIIADHIYVFVILNGPAQAVQYFIVPGKQMIDDPQTFDYVDPKFSGLAYKVLLPFENAWHLFFEPGLISSPKALLDRHLAGLELLNNL
jgi:hypothetical protein